MIKRKMGKANKIIGLDLDGVIIDHTENKLRVARDFGYVVSEKETASGIFEQKIPKEVREKIREIIYDDPVVSLTPPFMLGAEEGLRFIKETGFPYYLISRRDPKDSAMILLVKRGLWPFYFDETNTFFVSTKEEKNAKAKELEISIYIDDEPGVIEKLVSVPARFLFDNHRVYEEKEGYKKIHTWQEFLEAAGLL